MQNVKVRQMTGSRAGKAVANQFIVTTKGGEYFQSYDSVIVYRPFQYIDGVKQEGDMRIVLDAKFWDYSTTTGKYRNQFLGEVKAKIQAKIKSGAYVLADLNA